MTEADVERKAVADAAKEIIKTLETALKDEEKRRKIDDLLERFSVTDRRLLQDKISGFARYIDDICGLRTSSVLLSIISSGIPDVKNLLKLIEDPEVREWLQNLNFKYISTCEGVFPPFPNDWYRINWTTKIDFTHGNIPLVAITLLKRNGESVYLEMPFPSALGLVNHILRRIVDTKQIDISQVPDIRQQLEGAKGILESFFKETSKEQNEQG